MTTNRERAEWSPAARELFDQDEELRVVQRWFDEQREPPPVATPFKQLTTRLMATRGFGWQIPRAPDAALIALLHRGHDGFVCVCKRAETKSGWEETVSVPADALPGLWPQLVDDIGVDAFFGIHGFYRGGWGRNRRGYVDGEGNALQAGYRKNNAVRWLTACFADLDCYKSGRTIGDTMGKLIDWQDQGRIPPPSVMMRSGKGLWVFYVLVDDADAEHQGPVRSKGREETWSRIQNAIGQRFAELGADANARDLARVTRIPGSVNSSVAADSPNRVVSYWPQLDENGRVFRYTLDQLALEFNADLTPRRFDAKPPTAEQLAATPRPRPPAPADQATPSKPSKATEEDRANGSRGRVARYSRLLANFHRLWQLRGKFREGQRNAAVFTLAAVLAILRRTNHVTAANSHRDLERLWQDLHQTPTPYRRSEFDATVAAATKQAERGWHVKNQTLADQLDVTPDEARELAPWPCAATCHTKIIHGLSRADKAARRRGLLAEWFRDAANIPPLAAIRERLAEYRVSASIETIRQDLAAVGVELPRRKPRRQPDSLGTPLLPPD